MFALVAFCFGWMMGARQGPQGLEEVTDALVSLRESEEFAGLVTAVRKVAASVLRRVAERVGSATGSSGGTPQMPDVLARVYQVIRPAADDA